jgi:hypothetical protein
VFINTSGTLRPPGTQRGVSPCRDALPLTIHMRVEDGKGSRDTGPLLQTQGSRLHLMAPWGINTHSPFYQLSHNGYPFPSQCACAPRSERGSGTLAPQLHAQWSRPHLMAPGSLTHTFLSTVRGMLCCAVAMGCDGTWCGVVWCGLAWNGMDWCGEVVWCGAVWRGVIL